MGKAAAKGARIGHGGLTVERRFTTLGVHPFDEVEWELRDAVIGDPSDPVFEQRQVEFPKAWSQNATNIVAQKYFRGQVGTPQRERSVKQMIARVAGRITSWGRRGGYFATDEDADAFEAELIHILLHQKAAFNSPVWFNVGWRAEGEEQSSACFILSVEDTMESILDWNTQEGTIFKGGSGSGINLSKIRGSMEPLSKGGIASGPVSFMRGADPGVQYDTTINRWHTNPNTGPITASNPCSEYMSIDDSACNLASLNLMKFRSADGTFDVDDFCHAVDVILLAQEIVVTPSSYPTEKIGRNARAFRQLGLGYANLGALLMADAVPYDSDQGRNIAAAITALMTGEAYRKSAEIAGALDPYEEYERNRDAHNE